MKIVCCMKIVRDSGRVLSGLPVSRDELHVSEHDLVALEFCVRFAEREGAEVIALSVGPSFVGLSSKVHKDILARGADSLCLIADDDVVDWDSALATSELLARCLQSVPDASLIVFGDGSEDRVSGLTGPSVSKRLGMPVVNSAVSCSFAGDSLRVDRDNGRALELYEIELPAVLCVSSGAEKPRICSVKSIFGAAKKPVSRMETPAGCIESLRKSISARYFPLDGNEREGIILPGGEASRFIGALLEGWGDDR